MNASSLLMVTRSRTLGTFRTTTLSEVSSAAAITGSAEFFAPLTATLPRSAFPPLIRNLSIFHSAFFLRHSPLVTGHVAHLTKGNPQIVPCRFHSLPCLFRRNSQLQHHQRNAHVVSRRPQSVFRRRHISSACLRQNPQRPLRNLLICLNYINHQVFINMSKPRHRRGTQHVEHHFLRRPCLHPCRTRQDFRPHLRRDHNFRQPRHGHFPVRSDRDRGCPAPARESQCRQYVGGRPARRHSDNHGIVRQFSRVQLALGVPHIILRPFHGPRNRRSSTCYQRLHQLRWRPKRRLTFRRIQHCHAPARARAHINQPPAVANPRHGGRLIYVGAGSSGRMAVLDAAECQPTFGTPPKLVQALIAGGGPAITRAVEGAEDDVRHAERELNTRELTHNDVVVGVTASGTTPYVLAALRFARGRGATTVAITSNRKMPVARLAKIVIAAEVGPEVLTGSTRMKAGTAQKMVLNMLSTATMARLGHVYENLMIDVVQTNEKVAKRALRILAEASGRNVSAAEHALRAAGHNMRVALVMLKLGVTAKEARKRMKAAGDNLRVALGEMSDVAGDQWRVAKKKRGMKNG